MGNGREGIAASGLEINKLGSCREAHHVAGRPQEDRRCSEGEMGEGQGWKEVGVKSQPKNRARCLSRGLFSWIRNHSGLDTR